MGMLLSFSLFLGHQFLLFVRFCFAVFLFPDAHAAKDFARLRVGSVTKTKMKCRPQIVMEYCVASAMQVVEGVFLLSGVTPLRPVAFAPSIRLGLPPQPRAISAARSSQLLSLHSLAGAVDREGALFHSGPGRTGMSAHL